MPNSLNCRCCSAATLKSENSSANSCWYWLLYSWLKKKLIFFYRTVELFFKFSIKVPWIIKTIRTACCQQLSHYSGSFHSLDFLLSLSLSHFLSVTFFIFNFFSLYFLPFLEFESHSKERVMRKRKKDVGREGAPWSERYRAKTFEKYSLLIDILTVSRSKWVKNRQFY